MTLEQARTMVGEMVAYVPDGQPAELGRITSVNDAYVFVRYGDEHGSKATRAADLRELGGPKR